MPRREYVATYIHTLMAGEAPNMPAKQCHHFGWVELRMLMDFIYGGPPTKPEENL